VDFTFLANFCSPDVKEGFLFIGEVTAELLALFTSSLFSSATSSVDDERSEIFEDMSSSFSLSSALTSASASPSWPNLCPEDFILEDADVTLLASASSSFSSSSSDSSLESESNLKQNGNDGLEKSGFHIHSNLYCLECTPKFGDVIGHGAY
jgi:hypothetical protein